MVAKGPASHLADASWTPGEALVFSESVDRDLGRETAIVGRGRGRFLLN
jgi:hypothetical protein